MYSILSSDSEAKASELLENIEEMFPRYYMISNDQVLNHILSATERVKLIGYIHYQLTTKNIVELSRNSEMNAS